MEDDGKGISEAQIEGVGSLGLLGMKERANLLGGSLTVENRAAGGTRVTARLPLPGAEDSMGSVDP